MTRPTRDGAMPQISTLGDTRSDDWSSPHSFGKRAVTPTQRPAQDEADERLAQLARAIELEIIPRLMLAHRAANECPDVLADATRVIDEHDVAEFAKMAVAPGEDVAFACVEALRERGVSIESIYLDLLAPTARHLGELWTQDLCDFTEMAVGLGRLQRVLRELSPAFHDLDEAAPIGRRVLLLPCPGEQHTFGLVMVSEFFRRAGWEVSGGSWEFGVDAPNMVAADWYDVVGFSMGSECHADSLKSCVAAVRQSSRNSDIVIMAGGPLFALHPDMTAEVGADLVATDGKQAPLLAEQFLARRGSVLG